VTRDPVRDRLLAERAETAARVDALAADLAGIIDASVAVATDDEHDPEGATIAFERAQLATMLDLAERRLVDAEAALARWDTGEYDVCEVCGGRIPVERLMARPTTRRCVVCAALP
jgi:RNA polymerase-binding transcription factor DksA